MVRFCDAKIGESHTFVHTALVQDSNFGQKKFGLLLEITRHLPEIIGYKTAVD